MKKYLFLFLLICTAAFGQNVTQSKSAVDDLLCRSWKVEYAMVGDEKLPVKADIIFLFNRDNTFVVTLLGTAKSGKWALNTDEKFIEIINEKDKRMRIMSIAANEMTLTETPRENETGDTPKGSVFHAVPIN